MGEPHTADRCREESEGLLPDEDDVCKAAEQTPVCVCVCVCVCVISVCSSHLYPSGQMQEYPFSSSIH